MIEFFSLAAQDIQLPGNTGALQAQCRFGFVKEINTPSQHCENHACDHSRGGGKDPEATMRFQGCGGQVYAEYHFPTLAWSKSPGIYARCHIQPSSPSSSCCARRRACSGTRPFLIADP